MRKIFGKWIVLGVLLLCPFVFADRTEASTPWADWDGWPGLTKDDEERLIPTEKGIFPYIRKGDVNLAYEENKGVLGSPIYTADSNGNLKHAFILSLLEKYNKRLWDGTVRRYEYSAGSLIKGSSEWNLKKKMEDSARNGETERQFFYWLGNTSNKHSVELDVAPTTSPWYEPSANTFSEKNDTSTIIDDSGLAAGRANGLAESMGLNNDRLLNKTQKLHPSRWMIGYMLGHAYLYDRQGSVWAYQPSNYTRTLLPDMSQGSLMFIEKPSTALYADSNAKPRWLDTRLLDERPPVFFMQSNDGLMHGINVDGDASYGTPTVTMPKWKDTPTEFFAFMPPNAVQGMRLISHKFAITNDASKKRVVGDLFDKTLYDSNNADPGLANNLANHAVAGYLTDGPVVIRDMAISQSFASYKRSDEGRFHSKNTSDWRTSVFGMMGRGGAGLYSISFQRLDDISFNWAVENDLYRYDPRSGGSKAGAVVLWSSMPDDNGTNYDALKFGKSMDYPADGSDGGDYNYSRLGWNAPRPAFGIMKLKKAGSGSTETNAANVMIIAAGQHYISDTENDPVGNGNRTTVVSNNGNIGAAVYVSNPVNGKILYRATANTPIENADGKSVDMTGSDAKPQMGMMTTPVAATVVGKHLASPDIVGAITERTDQDAAFLRSAFTADNRGNIFELSFIDEDKSNGWGPLEKFEDIKTRRVASLRDNSADDTDNYIIPYMLAVAQDIRNGQIDEGTDLWICGGTADKATVAVDGVLHPLRNKKQYIFGFNRIPHGKKMSDLSILDDGVELYSTNKAASATYYNDNFKAWYIELGKDSPESEGEYVSAPPTMYMGQLYVATYLPKENAARVYILDPTNGKSYLGHKGGSKFAQIADININGLSPARIGTDTEGKAVVKMIASYTHEEGSSAPALNTGDNEGLDASSLAHNDEFGALTFDPFTNSAPAGTGELEAGIDYIYYWRRYNE